MSGTPQHTIKSKLKSWLRRQWPEYNRRLIEKDLRLAGKGLSLGSNVVIDYPELCLFGSNVTIGKACQINNLGGVVIADETTIGDGVILGGSKSGYSDLPIVIGRNCKIEAGVHLPPGRIIQDNTIVSREGMSKVKNPEARPNTSGNRRFFIVSTGAAGSRAIAKTLSQHPDIQCQHELNTLLISLSSAYEYGKITRDLVKRVLKTIYCNPESPGQLLLGESDQKLGNLIPILAELLPDARFIWIRRHALSFVESTAVKKKWYSEPPVREIPFVLGQLWATHRLNGHQAGAFTAQAWQGMTPIEKNAWYWQYWNTKIERHLQKIPADQWMTVELESLNDSINEVVDFLGVKAFSFQVLQDNIGVEDKAGSEDFLQHQQKIRELCSEGLKKWY